MSVSLKLLRLAMAINTGLNFLREKKKFERYFSAVKIKSLSYRLNSSSVLDLLLSSPECQYQ